MFGSFSIASTPFAGIIFFQATAEDVALSGLVGVVLSARKNQVTLTQPSSSSLLTNNPVVTILEGNKD